MHRTRETKLGDLIHAMLREEGLETPLNEFRAAEAWSKVMGQFVAKFTTNVTVQGGVMYVKVNNAALRSELMMNRASVAQRINQHVGAQVVQQIIIK